MSNYVTEYDLLKLVFTSKEEILKYLRVLTECSGFNTSHVKDALMHSGVDIDYDIILAYEIFFNNVFVGFNTNHKELFYEWGSYLVDDELNKLHTTLELMK